MGALGKRGDRSFTLTRRGFLAGSTGAGLVMAFGGASLATSAIAAIEDKAFSPTVWFNIDASGHVNVNIARAEMGQHVGTALARIVAEELGADWSKVGLTHVDTDPKWGYMVTGGSWSVSTSYLAMSQAGAAGRLVLAEAGAALLGADPADCEVRDGAVHVGDRSVTFGEIVGRGQVDRTFSADELAALPVKAASDRRLIGKPISALDVPEKSRGTARYGIDAERPGMVYARPLVPPTRYGSTVNGVDDSAAKTITGYQGFQVLEDPSETLQGWVVALADSYWAAHKAADAIVVDWTPGPTATVDEDAILAKGAELAAGDDGVLYVSEGDTGVLGDDALESTYRTHTALHFTLEPGNAVAEQVDGTWHLHSGNQWQSLILPVLATALQVEESQLVIHQYYLGGGFGRRLFGDTMLPAALASKAIGKPVKVVFNREDDSRFDCARSASVQTFRGQVGADGKAEAVDSAVVAGWPTLAMAPGFMPDGLGGTGKVDPFSASGANHWYSIPNHRVRLMNNTLAQETFLPGWLRAVGPGWIGWGVECFMDELAHAAGADPIDFRLAHLDAAGKNAGEEPKSIGGANRLAHVLRVVREQSGWGRDLPEDEGMGVACTFGQERDMPTWIGCVAHVKVDRASGKVTVKKLWQTIDCGTVVHPDGALAQAEGAMLWGVSLALHEGTRFDAGQVADRNLGSYTPLRMADIPELDIRFVESTEFPVGMGEPPLIPVAPAIGNAIHAAVGVRLRDLPMRPDDLKAALAT
ncbi:xanthine dehydrogenase family protein molybdopterin-binding subunit [Marinihelvus fidelis]|uniref:Xanthine dehydrogenase family protein molybdopterin-binding subunit n=1 Tax=Marinihelvus fidelis TaxID=2613842 RepID=A0A5N0TG05_9GAMM|nr:molybdopterin cofactor-binding domain-containing protein [Marinihelvus fidelis]KAA9133541.1 xanthine dehydrogenase family protein molybdopterin-binding subunit [Marinihelvus fidelis]